MGDANLKPEARCLKPTWDLRSQKKSSGQGPLSQGGPFFVGILNVTPDSFSDGVRFLAPERDLAQALRLAASGAAMFDVGAESTRPGATAVSPMEEWARLAPILEILRERLPGLPLSLDTRHAEVAAKGLDAGVSVLNDVAGFSDSAMLDLARHSDCGLIAMRSRVRDGALWMPDYGITTACVADEAVRELQAVRDRLLDQGVAPDRILLDPGFGFGMTFGEDLALWRSLPRLPELLSWPMEQFCIGVSRKRFLAWRNGTPELPPQERDGLTAVAHSEAAAMGYRVFRTHELP